MLQRKGSTNKDCEEPTPAPPSSAAKEKAEKEEEKEDTATLLEKMSKGSEEASKFANTAADFSHQAADAAATATKTAANGSLPLVRSVVHSSIVLALTVVKAVRIVGYSTLDVASAALQVSKAHPGSPCAAASASAMSLGFEALQAASAAASATEQAAAKLQSADPIEPEALAEVAGS